MNEVPQTGYTFVDTDAGGKGIGGGIGPLRGPKPFVTFYVVVRDLAATLKKATDGGGKVVFPCHQGRADHHDRDLQRSRWQRDRLTDGK